MAIKNVQDNRIKQARLKMKDAYNAYRQSITERDALVVTYLKEDWSTEYVASEFGIAEDKVIAIGRKAGALKSE